MRYKFIDELKGFTIVLVILAHVAERYYIFNMYPKSTLLLGIIYKSIYSFHMLLFMIISGFLFAYSYVDSNHILRKKALFSHAANLFIVYCIFSTFAYITKLLFYNSVLEPISWTQIFKIPFEPIGHLWYLHTLLLLYVINVIILVKIPNKDVLVLLISLVLELASTFFHPILPDFVNSCLKYEFFFFIGMLLSVKGFTAITTQGFMIITGLVSGIILIYSLLAFDDRPDNISIIQLPIALGISLSLFSVFNQNEQTLHLFEVFGKRSLEIYLLSQYPVTFLRVLLSKITFLHGLSSLLINVTFSLLVIYILIWLLNKIHLYNYLFKPYYKIKKCLK